MIHIIAHCWGQKYGREYVDRLEAGVKRNLRQPHRFTVVTEYPNLRSLAQPAWAMESDVRPLLSVPGCFVRLKIFDPTWQDAHGIGSGERIVSIDLDAVMTGGLDPLFDRPEPFVILQGVNSSNPGKFNGSMWMLRAGYRPDVWSDFSLDAAGKVPHFEFPDDQAWMEAKMPDAGAWTDKDGVFAFQKKCWPKGNALPPNARVVAFPGWRDPSAFADLSWIKQHWLNA